MHRACQLAKQVGPGWDVIVFEISGGCQSSVDVSIAFGDANTRDGEARMIRGDAD